MSDESGLTDQPEGESFEEILAKLLREAGLNFHTQVDKPDSMTLIDVYGEHLGRNVSPGVGKLVNQLQLWKRRNMVSYKRGRAKEIVEAIKAQVDDKRKKDIEAVMLGRDR